MPGSLNDINVLNRSLVFVALVEGRAPPVNYTINGHEYTMGYYLADGIYLNWSTFVNTIPMPLGEKRIFISEQSFSCEKFLVLCDLLIVWIIKLESLES